MGNEKGYWVFEVDSGLQWGGTFSVERLRSSVVLLGFASVSVLWIGMPWSDTHRFEFWELVEVL